MTLILNCEPEITAEGRPEELAAFARLVAKGGDVKMPAEWTGEVVGRMHVEGISIAELAKQLGKSYKYVANVLNGRYNPARAEETYKQALDEIIEQRKGAEHGE